jgi:uncharacterized protein (DUF1499 family)
MWMPGGTMPAGERPRTSVRGFAQSGGFLLLLGLLTGCMGGSPTRLGGLMAGLSPCPGTPNCVQTDLGRLAPGWEAHAPSGLMQALESAVQSLPRTRIVATELGGGGVYLHAESRSRILGFVDDLELRIPPGGAEAGGAMGVRSASRVGHSDMGVNAKRVERLRGILLERGLIEP